jgi:hypothetical protein
MTGTNEFLPFGIGTGANVLDQADYDGLPARDAGFSSGIARSVELNKVWRQASVIAAIIGQFIADHSGGDALDDGDTATLLGLFEAALAAAIGGGSGFAPVANSVHIGVDTGVADAMVATFTPDLTVLTDGLFFEITPAATNTGATTLNANGTGVKSVVRTTGAALSAGDIQAGAKTLVAYDTTLGKYVLITPHLGSLANYVLKAGDTMTGALTLFGAPTSSLHAATKAYVDAVTTSLSAYLLKSGGTMTGALTLSGAPTASLHAATKAYVDAVSSALANYLLKSGGTMTGYLTLNGAPTASLHAATKAYVDGLAMPSSKGVGAYAWRLYHGVTMTVNGTYSSLDAIGVSGYGTWRLMWNEVDPNDSFQFYQLWQRIS